MIYPYQLAKLCEFTYDLTKYSKSFNFENFYLNNIKDHISGLFAASFLNKKENILVISFRGTDFDLDKEYGIGHALLDTIGSNIPIIMGGVSNKLKKSISTILPKDWQDLEPLERAEPLQLQAALSFAKSEILKNLEFNVIITGHSLGGFLAQAVGVDLNFPVVAFDSPGAKNYLLSHFERYDSSKISIYNSFPNIINTMHAHAVKPYFVAVDSFVEGLDFNDYLKFSIDQHSISKISNSLKEDRIYEPRGKWLSNALSGYCAFIDKYFPVIKDMEDFPLLSFTMCLGKDSFDLTKLEDLA